MVWLIKEQRNRKPVNKKSQAGKLVIIFLKDSYFKIDLLITIRCTSLVPS